MRLIDADALIGALHNYAFLEGDDRSICYNIIQRQPTIEPERLSDKEQRIFLAAMGRHEHVCKHVDAAYGDSYEDGLLRICHEITRKVKGALWTI